SRRSSAMRAPQARRMREATGSRSNAYKRCSRVTFSCLRALASAKASRKVDSSSLVMLKAILPQSNAQLLVPLHGGEEGELRLPGHRLDAADLGLRDLVSVHAGDARATAVHLPHEVGRLRRGLVEDR